MFPIEIRKVPAKGRGVFAGRAIRANELIERAPVLIIPREPAELLEESAVDTYWYAWRDDQGSVALVLGYGMIYNHSYEPNARYQRQFDEPAMDYIAVRDIAQGEEICINYNGRIDDRSEVWFEVLP